jgi:hypothetical protein
MKATRSAASGEGRTRRRSRWRLIWEQSEAFQDFVIAHDLFI